MNHARLRDQNVTPRAFTLLELMVTFIILALITAIAIPAFTQVIATAHYDTAQAAALDAADNAMATLTHGYTVPTIADYQALIGSTNPDIVSVVDNLNGTATFTMRSGNALETVCISIPATRATPPAVCSSTTSTTTTTVVGGPTTTTTSVSGG